MPTDKIVAGASLPIHVQAFDAANNEITYTSMPFSVSVEGGSFDAEGLSHQQTIMNFQDAAYLLQTKKEDSGNTVIVRLLSDAAATEAGGYTDVLFEQILTLVDGEWRVQSVQGDALTDLSYRLPNKAQ